MKKRLLLFLLIIAAHTAIFAQNKGVLKVFFTAKQSNQDLMALKKNMLEIYNIQLEYNHLKFDQEGRLEEIAFSVDFRNGMKCNYGPVVVSKKKQYGFIRDYRKRAKSPYSCGKR